MGNIDRDSFSEVACRCAGLRHPVLLVAGGGIHLQPGQGLPLGYQDRRCAEVPEDPARPPVPSSVAKAPCMQPRGQQGLRTSSGALEGSTLPGSGWGWVCVRVGVSSACLRDALRKAAAVLHHHPPSSLRYPLNAPLRHPQHTYAHNSRAFATRYSVNSTWRTNVVRKVYS